MTKDSELLKICDYCGEEILKQDLVITMRPDICYHRVCAAIIKAKFGFLLEDRSGKRFYL